MHTLACARLEDGDRQGTGTVGESRAFGQGLQVRFRTRQGLSVEDQPELGREGVSPTCRSISPARAGG